MGSVEIVAFALAGLCALMITVHLASLALAFLRLKTRRNVRVDAAAKPVSLVIPLRGIEAFSHETLERAFNLQWPDFELLFCVADHDDPICQVARAVIERYPAVPARLLIGDDRVSSNPKLNNCIKGWRAARHDWVVLADSNVAMPRNYIQRLAGAWRDDTGLVCSPPLGTRPQNFWAEVECAFLNTYQARWQYAAEASGRGFAQGKSMLWNKPLLDANGGIEALGEEIAEDAASTKLINGLGLKVRLSGQPFEQPLGARAFSEVWSRQARWARLRRVTFPLYYAPEILVGAMPPLVFALAAAALLGISLPLTALSVLTVFYLPEVLFAAGMNWRAGPRALAAMLARDMLLPAISLRGWMGAKVEWRGNAMDIRTDVQVLE